jgi:hypothetical protein
MKWFWLVAILINVAAVVMHVVSGDVLWLIINGAALAAGVYAFRMEAKRS